MRAIQLKEFGGPEVLELVDVPELQECRAHHLLNVTRAGVNFADVHARTNSYLTPVPLPYIPGNEVVGTTADGRRFVGLTRGGGYAEQSQVHRRVAWEIPDDVTDDQAVCLALQGQSAWHVLYTFAQVAAGETVVIPAAGGGFGSLAVQLAKRAGAKVIALASTEEKRRLARELGADATVDSTTSDLPNAILDAAGGPVQVALEMTGGKVLRDLVSTLAHRGRMVVYGYASGTTTGLPTYLLLEKSIAVMGFWLPHLYSDREALPTSMEKLFDHVRKGEIRTVHGATYALGDARVAHAVLATRAHTGKLALDTTR
ncbi:quinone oxidoreductase family protein [Streptomyces sp. 4N509B]|uniref:quinone oxidoreductase family protein n=1 Tax=Streptomyces sp. 4N509B TaxID=3457413 RepID=UPI003FD53044